MSKKVFIKTWGCQMNVYDSARIADIASGLGYAATEKAVEAGLLILNTCHIREKASEKLFSELGRLRLVKKLRAEKGERTLIVVAGCVAQAMGEEIRLRAPFVDIVLGPQTIHRLPEMIECALHGGESVIDTEFPPESKFDFLPAPAGNSGVSVFLTVQEGCNRFCSYCVVPYTRGAEYARPAEEILEEARAMAAAGAREITLLGQNVNAWKHGGKGLGALIRDLAEIPGFARIRYTTSHPLDMGEELISAHRDVPKLMPFLHIPAQSGSDAILAAMNRKHTADDYRRTVDRLRAARSDLALSSDFIVGFPGETDKDFQATLRLVRDIGFSQAYSFKYSRRPGTPAADMPGQIPESVKTERLRELQKLLNEQQEKFNSSFDSKTLSVLFESAGKRGGFLFGRTPYWQAVQARGEPDLIGKEVSVVITSCGKTGLTGKITD